MRNRDPEASPPPAAGREEASSLTAEEVQNLDLRGCELVVLSACEIGLGKRADIEGILGLRRALLASGAKSDGQQGGPDGGDQLRSSPGRISTILRRGAGRGTTLGR
jgi:hypothetical protein